MGLTGFPLANLPPRRFGLGDRVMQRIPDGVTEDVYTCKGTVLGYELQHPLQLRDGFSDITWVYSVIWNQEDTKTALLPQYPSYVCEDELEPIQGDKQAEVRLSDEALSLLFADLPDALSECCQVSIKGSVEAGMSVEINCRNAQIADNLWARRDALSASLKAFLLPGRVILRVQGQGIHSVFSDPLISIVRSSISIPVIMSELIKAQERATRHRSLLQAIGSQSVTTTLHDANEEGDFFYLDIFCSIPQRLNKPKERTIGKPLSFIDPAISEPRRHYIKRCVANGQCEKYTYTYEDEFFWKFDVSVAPIYGTEEVITIVTDAESWQLGHWLNKVDCRA